MPIIVDVLLTLLLAALVLAMASLMLAGSILVWMLVARLWKLGKEL